MHKTYCLELFLSLISKLDQVTVLINERYGLDTLIFSHS